MAQNYQLQKTGQEIDDLLDKIDGLGPASSESAGTMSAADKEKLDDIESGAETNVIEGIVLGETSLTPSASKTITIPVDSEPAEGSENPVASGGVYDALGGKMDKDTSAGENDIAVFNDEGQVVGAFDVNEVVREGRIKQTTGQSTTDLMSQKAVTDALDTKAAKDEDAVEGNLAKFDSNGNPVDAGIAAENVAQKGEIQTYSGNLVDTRSAGTAQEFTYRKSGGDGVNWMRRIKGKSLVWNQLVKEINTTNYTQGGMISIADGKITFTGTGESYYASSTMATKVNIVADHTYFFAISVSNNTITKETEHFSIGNAINAIFVNIPIFGVTGRACVIKQATTSQTLNVVGYNASSAGAVSVGETCSVSDIVFIDLTLMFGEGKEPSTVEEFEALYNEPYYPYQPGVIKNNDAVEMESVGFNQWDEEWEVGAIDNTTGEDKPYANNIRSKNYIKVFPGTSYNFTSPTGVWYFWYDANKTFLSAAYSTSTMFQVVSPSEARFLRIQGLTAYGITYNNDICINLSDASRNGEYEPYWKKSIQLGLNAFRVTDGTNIITVNGLKSAGPVYDEISGGKYIKRVGVVDLGTLNWELIGGNLIVCKSLTDAKPALSVNNIGNLLTNKYIASYWNDASANKIVAMNNVGWLRVQDSEHTSVPTEQDNWLSGVMLNYELATPEVYDLVDDIPNAIEVDENGTERAIFPEAVDPSAPFCSDSNYSVSTANLVRKLNDAS